MSRLTWDSLSERYFETGTRQAVLFLQNEDGTYAHGVSWNGLVSCSETFEEGEAIHVYATDAPYTDIYEIETFGFKIEAYTYPREFEECNGFVRDGDLLIPSQEKRRFAFCYKTIFGNDTKGTDYDYRIHIVYDCHVNPIEREYKTLNNSLDILLHSWDIDAQPINYSDYRPFPMIIIDYNSSNDGVLINELDQDLIFGENAIRVRTSTSLGIKVLEDYLYGNEYLESTLLLPDAVSAMLKIGHLITENSEDILIGGDKILV